MLTNLSAPTFACNPNSETWSGKNLATCAEYEMFSWCTSDGDYGKNWEHGVYGTFEDEAAGGYDGRSCPGCGCTPEGEFVYAKKAHNRFI